jgi:hypothetical protein
MEYIDPRIILFSSSVLSLIGLGPCLRDLEDLLFPGLCGLQALLGLVLVPTRGRQYCTTVCIISSAASPDPAILIIPFRLSMRLLQSSPGGLAPTRDFPVSGTSLVIITITTPILTIFVAPSFS